MRRPAVFIFILCMAFIAANASAGETTRQREQRESDKKQLLLRMDEINRKIDSQFSSLRSRGSGLSDKNSALKEESLKELGRLQEEVKKQRETAGKKLSQLGSVSGAEFDRLKAEVNSVIQDLSNLYQRMSSLGRAQ